MWKYGTDILTYGYRDTSYVGSPVIYSSPFY